MTSKTRSRLITLGLVALVGVSVLVITRLADSYANSPHLASGQSKQLQGTDLGSTPAPAFTLPDQSGTQYSLAGLKGRVVVMTFIDSQCPHADCPLMAQYLNQTAQLLGPQAKNAEWVALSLNPTDTPATAQKFIQGNNVTFPFHILLGNQDQLTPLWSAYHITSVYNPEEKPKPAWDHSEAGVFLIDQQGRERIYLGAGFDPKMLADDVRLLLAA